MPELQLGDRAGWMGVCSNVLPTRDLAGLRAHVAGPLRALRERAFPGLDPGEPMAVGLWLPARAAAELDADAQLAGRVGTELHEAGLWPATLNGFPYGDFHGDRVKGAVFRPAWDEPARREYTLQLARLLARWLPEGSRASISTVPLGLGRSGDDFERACAAELRACARELAALHRATGREIAVAIEPEPGASIGTMAQLAAFHARWLRGGPGEGDFRRHLAACWDLCHQAVEHEDAATALAQLRECGVEVAKVQVSNALRAVDPSDPAVRERLARFAEPRWLHQVGARLDGRTRVAGDLEALLAAGEGPLHGATEWRVHFHVPLHREELSGLGTTQAQLRADLAALLEGGVSPRLELETYSWGVLPGEAPDGEALVDALADELRWVAGVMAGHGASGAALRATAPPAA